MSQKFSKEVKIAQKISIADFVRVLRQRPSRIIISESILRQCKGLRLMVDTLSATYDATVPPVIEILKRGMPPKIIKQDWVDSYIRTLIGYKPDVDDLVMIKLLDADATAARKALPISELNQTEIKLLPRLRNQERIMVTQDLKIYLTKLGIKIAEGAKKIYE